MDIKTLRFVAVAAILYGLLHFLYHLIPDSTLRTTIYPNIIGHPSAAMINAITPERDIRIKDNKIISNKATLNIVRGCDGSGVWFMLIAAVIAFWSGIKQTFVGLLAGTAVVYIINQLRIVGLFYVVEYNRDWFDPFHVYFFPSLIILIIASLFLIWAKWATNLDRASPSKE